MNEKVLAFIWFNRLYENSELITTQGEKVDIIKTGFQNKDSGPDVTQAQIYINNILWVGNVEFHVKSSHWFLHNHHNDPAYNNIILHVVFEDDKPLLDNSNNFVPTLILSFKKQYSDKYYSLINKTDNQLCETGISKLGSLKTSCMIDRLGIERLSNKANQIYEALKINKGDWNQTFWQFLMRTFGFGKNAVPFELLAKSLPYTLIEKNKHSFSSVLALLYGQAGFFNLKKFDSEKFENLKNEYNYLKHKYNLVPIQESIWKFSGIRPSNFPQNRLGQIAMIAVNNSNLFSLILELKNIHQLNNLFCINNLKIDKIYHGDFSEIGEETRNLIIINLVCPFLYCYSQYTGNEEMSERAVNILESLPPEKNSIILSMAKKRLTASSAFESQAIIQLNNEYCKLKKCIECQVGRYLLLTNN
ncbi:MAG: DUF2851 family protein [Bacteroidales bacterium]|nr:DUF2851 family protein [Bacteroidales bacterium]